MTSARAFRSPDPGGPVPGAPSRLRFPQPGLPPPAGERVLGLRHVPLVYASCGWFRRKARARTVPPPERLLARALALAGPVRHQLWRRCSSRGWVWAFPPFTGERKRSQTLNFKGGNTSWLTKNPSLKSASAASRLRIWQNETEGRTRHNVTFSRLYKDGEQWKTTQSFGNNDLLVLAKVADQAHSRIFELQQEDEPQAES